MVPVKDVSVIDVDPAQTTLDHVRRMTVPLQQAWLKRLKARYLRAARLALDADEAKRQEAKLHAQVHQKLVTWQVLHAAIDDINLWEKGIIDRLVRQYGNLVFDTFHKQIDVYNQRRQAWIDVYSDWEHAGKPFDQKDRLIDWLEAAIRSASPSAMGPVPERPKFESEHPAKIAARGRGYRRSHQRLPPLVRRPKRRPQRRRRRRNRKQLPAPRRRSKNRKRKVTSRPRKLRKNDRRRRRSRKRPRPRACRRSPRCRAQGSRSLPRSAR